MKIALVTIQNANNYGALLQAYALQEVLAQYAPTEIINYDNKHLGKSFELIRFNSDSLHGVLTAGKDICRIFPRKRVIKYFRDFIDNNINLTPSYTREELEQGKAGHYDYYVSGSDQIWNPKCISNNKELDSTYFLSFAEKDSQKIAFSSSVGGYKYSDKEKMIVKDLLKDFVAIGVREKNTQKSLQKLLGREVYHTLDPTLLLSKNEWLNKIGESSIDKSKEKYILLYTVPKTPLVREMVDAISKLLNLKIVSLDQGLTAGANVDEQIRDAGPADFMHLFKHAEFVITDSFHGACFSVNFSKPFAAIAQGKEGSVRVKSFLSIVGLEDRFISNLEDLKIISLEVDFTEPMKKLNQAKQKSMSVLSNIFTIK